MSKLVKKSDQGKFTTIFHCYFIVPQLLLVQCAVMVFSNITSENIKNLNSRISITLLADHVVYS